MPEYTEKQIARFWARVNKNGSIPAQHPELGACWEWMGGGNGVGYGQVRLNHRQIGTHQAAWELTHGAVPPGMWVLRKCENPLCCNPNHLYLGTAKDNRRRMSKLTRAQADDIRRRYDAGTAKQKDLAAEYRVSIMMVNLIVNRKAWID